MYSCPVDAVVSTTLHDRMGMSANAEIPEVALESDVVSTSNIHEPVSKSPDGHLYFSVVKARPSSWHTLPGTKKMRATDTIISVHPLAPRVPRAEDERFLNLTDISAETDLVRIIERFSEVQNVEQLKTGFKRWSLSPSESFFSLSAIPGDAHFQHLLSTVVTSMVGQNAFQSVADTADTKRLYTPRVAAEVALLDTLVQRRDALQHSDGYQLTLQGLQRLQMFRKLVSPTSAFEPRDLPFKDRTLFELMYELKVQGWTWMKQPTSKALVKKLQQEGYKAGLAKTYYTNRTCSRLYLLCLLTADDLFEKGITHIPHASSAEVYKALLNKKDQRDEATQVAVALEADGVAGGNVFDNPHLEELAAQEAAKQV
eukprot:6476975-Amphidinium_carterae.1